MAILDPNLLPITRSHPKEVGANPSPLTPQQTPKGASFADDLCFSELWAGPAYSDSPPPSSLPIPKYYLRQKRSVSLELPVRRSEVTMPPIIKISALFSHQRVHFFHQQLPSY
ncbi:hypothetical protein MUK42_01524 [Musa troglodytarum]|uniref:Uncharacterized protein n=1 Tax=Musa troglodytarum TaxID=320322 RepID=A0A9E7JUW1_9LILI|nr:hypothetical protein MUK42_01524 [Musa troglodytarum]